MNEHLIIRNFGPVTSLDIDIKPFTVFIGEQGSGKSTISKVLTICRDKLFQIAIKEQKTPEEPFKEFDIFDYFCENTFLEYTGDCTIRYQNESFSIEQNEDTPKHVLSTTKDKLRDLYSHSNINDIYSSFWFLADSEYLLKELLYIPSERVMATQLFPSLANIIRHNIPLGMPVLEYMSLFEKARNTFTKYQVPFLGITYKFVNNQNIIEVEDNKSSVSLANASSGIQSVLPLLMVFDYCSKQGYFNSFVIEEPEQNLFPSSQVELLRFILSRRDNKDKNARFVITTHSPYMLSALNNYLYAAELANNPLVDKEEVDAVVPSNCQISIDDCAVYSLGKNLNGGEYCKSVISEETHLIDFNYLDKVSMDMGSEFDRLQNIYLNSLRKNRK